MAQTFKMRDGKAFIEAISAALGLPKSTVRVVIEAEQFGLVVVYAKCIPEDDELERIVNIVREVGVSENGEALQSAVRRHRDERGDDRCWEDDERLYAALPEGLLLPVRECR